MLGVGIQKIKMIPMLVMPFEWPVLWLIIICNKC